MKRNVLLKRGAFIFSIYLLMALLLFISAGTFKFLNAWLFLGLAFFPVFITILVLSFDKTRILEINIDFYAIFKKNIVNIVIFSIIFVIGLIAAGINKRFELSQLPLWLVIQFSVIFLFALILLIFTFKEYKILSRHLFERRRKKLIDQGPYSIIRHPMYSSLILIFLSIPVILGSMLSFVIYLFFPIYMIIKMFKEEKNLTTEIRDYSNYKERVKYKIIPYIW